MLFLSPCVDSLRLRDLVVLFLQHHKNLLLVSASNINTMLWKKGVLNESAKKV